MTLDSIKNEIEKANSIVILTHESPDGDAMGSSLGMYFALKNLEKHADLIIPEYSNTYSFLPGIENVKQEGNREGYDLAIALDCTDIKRLNGFSEYFESAKFKIVIDHHSVNSMFGDLNYVNPASPACAQILFLLFQYWGMEITKEIGTCLLTGIITDTGGFKYSNTTAESFELAAWLLNKGINVSEIYRKSMQVIPKSRFDLTLIALNRLELLEDGKIAFTYITMEDEEKVNAKNGDHEGIVEFGRDIEGVEVSIFIRESDKGYKVSLRSNEYVNVSDICIIFGGGGHQKAAGCTLPFSFESAREKIINETKSQLK